MTDRILSLTSLPNGLATAAVVLTAEDALITGLKVQAPATASGTITLPSGTTDFSVTGGPNQVVMQVSPGAPFTVGLVSGGGLTPTQANIITPISGSTVTLTDLRPVYVNTNELAALTIRLPVVVLGQVIEIGFKSPVTVLTILTNAGIAIPGAPVNAFGPGSAIQMRFETLGWVYWK